MAPFACTRCGKCCISLGRHIRIERSLSPVQYYCRVAVNGELLPVSVQPELRELFASGDQRIQPGARSSGKTLLASSPAQFTRHVPASAGNSGAGR